MNFSEKTFNILKNFSTINNNILIEPGSNIRTVNDVESIFAKATVTDVFPVKFGIYDLGEFLNVINLMGGPEKTNLDFQEKLVVLSDENKTMKVEYWYASEKVLKFPEKNINMPESLAAFEISNSVFNQLKRAASTFNHPKMVFFNTESDCTEVFGKTFDPQVSSSNVFEMKIAKTSDNSPIFSYVFDIQNLKYLVLESNADVFLAAKGKGKIAEFSDGTVSYFVAVNSSSTMS